MPPVWFVVHHALDLLMQRARIGLLLLDHMAFGGLRQSVDGLDGLSVHHRWQHYDLFRPCCRRESSSGWNWGIASAIRSGPAAATDSAACEAGSARSRCWGFFHLNSVRCCSCYHWDCSPYFQRWTSFAWCPIHLLACPRSCSCCLSCCWDADSSCCSCRSYWA